MIQQVGETKIKSKHTAKCHCGAVELELNLPNGIEHPRRCNCSMCRRKGVIAASIKSSNLRIVHGTEFLSYYQFNTLTAKHYFCSKCGIHTHHQRRSNPAEYGFNVGCLDDVNPFDLGEIITSDGINHVSDQKQK
jgi:hypothetical protein